MSIIPPKLKKGDRIMVVAPSKSLSIVSEKNRAMAIEKLNDLGFVVELSTHSLERDSFDSSSIDFRVSDIHQAFLNKEVKAIFTAIGGHNVNQILKYLDYELIKNNPKIICGYSDITVLLNAIYAKTGLVTYLGPHFSSFAMTRGIDYTVEYFMKCFTQNNPFEIYSSKRWSDDQWYIDQQKRVFIKNQGIIIIRDGKGEGTVVGGNLNTFNLLQGTEYMPEFKNFVLLIEDDDLCEKMTDVEFDRNLQSLIHLNNFNNIQGLLIGRFQKKSAIFIKRLTQIIKTKNELKNVPVLANIDFGHTTPQITFPIGGEIKFVAKKGVVELVVNKH